MKPNFLRTFGGALIHALLLQVLGLGIVGATLNSCALPEPQGTNVETKPNIVLVHGAFADSSGWNGVVSRLLTQGYSVVAVANPLRGLKSDSAYLAAMFQNIPGPIVAVGHSYAGAVISAAAVGCPKVKALVFVAGLALDEGESAADISDRFPGSTLGPTLASPVPLQDGGRDLFIQQNEFHAQFAEDVPEAEAKLMAAIQRPITELALHDSSGPPAWKFIPSWFIFGSRDRNITETAHLFMAQRANAVEAVDVKEASHVVMISHPDEVAALIKRAAQFPWKTTVSGNSQHEQAKSVTGVSVESGSFGPAQVVPLASQPPARLNVDPPLPEQLARGYVVVRYRAENARILPVYGSSALGVSPRLAHLHVTVDHLPWHWLDASGEPISINGLAPGSHRILIELESPTHKVIDSKVIIFDVPERPETH